MRAPGKIAKAAVAAASIPRRKGEAPPRRRARAPAAELSELHDTNLMMIPPDNGMARSSGLFGRCQLFSTNRGALLFGRRSGRIRGTVDAGGEKRCGKVYETTLSCRGVRLFLQKSPGPAPASCTTPRRDSPRPGGALIQRHADGSAGREGVPSGRLQHAAQRRDDARGRAD